MDCELQFQIGVSVGLTEKANSWRLGGAGHVAPWMKRCSGGENQFCKSTRAGVIRK